ncbi:MAG: OsmC family protein [Polyangiaceae bacterium]|nr:OsmC family protein [Polyangiaceae bacterium]
MSQAKIIEKTWGSYETKTPHNASTTKRVAELHLRVEQIDGFEFRIHFDKNQWTALLVDEPPPLGKNAGPNATRVLAASIGNCLCASLLFCLTRENVIVNSIDADVSIEVARNERHRLRIPRMRVTLWPRVPDASEDFARCVKEFQDFCVVTESVREGIDVLVEVEPIVDGLEGPTS